MWCHIIMFSFSLVSVFLAWTLDYTFRQSLTSFLCSPGVLSVLLSWSSMFGVPILVLLIPLLLELSAGRHLPLLGHRLPSTMLAFYLECLNIFLATLYLLLSFLF